ncbi:AMP-binding protein [Vibrio sp.]|uniref:AMP-binding protein n=1 Tax=Vibrio sp. TaxID=678 RepID=UPI00311E0986
MKTLSQLLIQAFKSNANNVATTEYPSIESDVVVERTYKDIQQRVARLQSELLHKLELIESKESVTVGIVARNSSDWIVADLTCLFTGVTSLPLPQAFSLSQAQHLAKKCDVFICDGAGEATLRSKWKIGLDKKIYLRFEDVLSASNDQNVLLDLASQLPTGRCKIIHTSGTTSQPKGVELSTQAIVETYKSLSVSIPQTSQKAYLSLVPLSLLLEQVTGIYLPLINGGNVNFLPPDMPIIGENKCDIKVIINWIKRVQPTAITAPPILIEGLLKEIQHGDEQLLHYLQNTPHITCGGARVATHTLKQLRELGVDAYQGYGLSENASVVSVNTTQHNRLGSVGRPLPHVEVRIAKSGCIEIKSPSLFSGYSGQDPSSCLVDKDGWLDTGDIGYLDEENYLYVSGRKKNILCLPNGINVYPEEIESELQKQTGILAAVMFLDDLLGTVILLKVNSDIFDKAAIEKWMDKEFSEVERPNYLWVMDKSDVTLDNLFTVTDRPKREAIKDKFKQLNNIH